MAKASDFESANTPALHAWANILEDGTIRNSSGVSRVSVSSERMDISLINAVSGLDNILIAGLLRDNSGFYVIEETGSWDTNIQVRIFTKTGGTSPNDFNIGIWDLGS